MRQARSGLARAAVDQVAEVAGHPLDRRRDRRGRCCTPTSAPRPSASSVKLSSMSNCAVPRSISIERRVETGQRLGPAPASSGATARPGRAACGSSRGGAAPRRRASRTARPGARTRQARPPGRGQSSRGRSASPSNFVRKTSVLTKKPIRPPAPAGCGWRPPSRPRCHSDPSSGRAASGRRPGAPCRAWRLPLAPARSAAAAVPQSGGRCRSSRSTSAPRAGAVRGQVEPGGEAGKLLLPVVQLGLQRRARDPPRFLPATPAATPRSRRTAPAAAAGRARRPFDRASHERVPVPRSGCRATSRRPRCDAR